MKANELRIGNWVLIPYNKSNKQEGFFEATISQIGDFGAYIKPEDYEPILLTEEWLFKFGFEKTMSWTYVKDLVGNLKLVYYLGEKGWSIGFKSYSDFPNLKYVHQLQNLYFALRDEELTYGGNK